MVERDRFEKQFRAGWLSAFRYARDRQVSSGEITDKLVSSLAKTLREHGGILAFDDIARLVTQGRELGVLAAFGGLDDLAELQGGHRHTRIATEVAKSLFVQWESSAWNVGGGRDSHPSGRGLLRGAGRTLLFLKGEATAAGRGKIRKLRGERKMAGTDRVSPASATFQDGRKAGEESQWNWPAGSPPSDD